MINFRFEIRRGVNNKGEDFILAFLTNKEGETKKFNVLSDSEAERWVLTCEMLRADGINADLVKGDIFYRDFWKKTYLFKCGDYCKIFYWNDINFLKDDQEEIKKEIKKRYGEVKRWIKSLYYEEKIVVFDFDDKEDTIDNYKFKVEKNNIKDQIEYAIVVYDSNNKNIYEKRFFTKDDEILYVLPTNTICSNEQQIELLKRLKEETDDCILKEFVKNEIEYIEYYED